MKKPLSFATISTAILLILGFALRLRQYLSGRSLWLDEAMLALNILNRDFAGLFKPLDYDQGAPVGFLLIEKFFNAILGRNELVLRFFPFLAGIAALWLFYLLLRRTVHGAGFFITLALFAVNPQLIYYSSESKQYMVDVAITLALLVIALPILRYEPRKQDYIFLGLAGIFSLWLSHPALFVLAGIGAAIIFQHIQKRDSSNPSVSSGHRLRLAIWMGGFWLVNLALLYFVSLRHLSNNFFLMDYWTEAFLPMPLWSNPNWFVTFFEDNIQFQFGIKQFPWLALMLLPIGWFALYREMRTFAMTLAFITFFAFAASALRLYPVSGRLALFLIPLGIILLGKTVEVASRIFTNNKFLRTGITLALCVYLIYSPFMTSFENFISPRNSDNMRLYLDYLAASWRDDDVIFVSYWAEPAFLFYAPFYHLENIPYEASEYADYPDPQKLTARIDPLVGHRRVWVLFSHVYEQGWFNERDIVVAYLDEIGMKRREFRRANTSVYLLLYDLSK
jgi:uncharacterized membrane protein